MADLRDTSTASATRLPSSASSSSVSAAVAQHEHRASPSSISSLAEGSNGQSRRSSSPGDEVARRDAGVSRLERGVESVASTSASGRARTPPVPSPMSSRLPVASPGYRTISRSSSRPQTAASPPSQSSSSSTSTRRTSTSSSIPIRSPKLRPRRTSSNSISPSGSTSSVSTLTQRMHSQLSTRNPQLDLDELGYSRRPSSGSETAAIGLGSRDRRRGSGQIAGHPSIPTSRSSYSMTTSVSGPGGPDGPSRSLSRSATESVLDMPGPSTSSPDSSPRHTSMAAPIFAPYNGTMQRRAADAVVLGPELAGRPSSPVHGTIEQVPLDSPLKSSRTKLRIIPPSAPDLRAATAIRDKEGSTVFCLQESETRNQLLGRPSPPIPAKNPLRGLPRTDSNNERVISGVPRACPEHSASDGVSDVNPESAKSCTTVADLSNRYSTLTMASEYSQPSAPSTATAQTATWPAGTNSLSDHSTPTSANLRGVSWGNRRGSYREDAEGVAGAFVTAMEMSQSLDKSLPPAPSGMKPAPPLFPPRSPSLLSSEKPPTPPSASSKPRLEPRLPVSPIDIVRANQVVRDRSRSNPSSPLVPMSARETEQSRPPLPRSPSTSLPSRRAHLIHEICTTEQSYASEMALVRDAYMLRFIRPASQHSHATTNAGDVANSPGAFSDRSRRSSTFTYETADTRGTSVVDLSIPNGNGLYPLIKSPSGLDVTSPSGASGSSSYFTSPMASTPSGSTGTLLTPQFSPRASSLPPSAWNPRSSNGTHLSSNDVRAVFLNLEQIAAFADELAATFEAAAGEELGGPGAVAREGEGGTDTLGQAFLAAVPRLQSLYTVYCGRQAQANARLVELLADPAHAAHLAECWALVKPHTNAWDLGSMLIKPVQRVLKYPLLFADLLACTSPVHPDYFNLRKASEAARAVADEINEVKRRKDVVERVMAGSQKKREVSSSSTMSKDSKSSSGGLSLAGLKRFRKDKSISLPVNHLTADLTNPTFISPRSHGQLRELTMKMEDSEKAVRRIGTEVVKWVKSAEALLVTEDSMMAAWTHVYQLDTGDRADERVLAFRKTLQQISRQCHAALAREVETKVMPIFSKLLLIAINPRAVIAKKDHKSSDYNRFVALRDNGKAIDKNLSQIAHDYVALHTQLLEELPTFLEGYCRILDLALAAWAQAQSHYHFAVHTELQNFANQWFAPMDYSRAEISPDRAANMLYDERPPGRQTLDGRMIVKTWHDAWQPYADAFGHFNCTRPGPARGPSRTTTFRMAGPSASRASSIYGGRDDSRAASPSPTAAKLLRHSSSVSSSSSSVWRQRQVSSQTASPGHSSTQLVMRPPRKRSTSLMGPEQTISQQVTPLSPVKADSRFSLLRRSNSKTVISRNSSQSPRPLSTMGPPPVPTRSQPPSATSSANPSPRASRIDLTANTSRYSFGLPLLAVDATQPIFSNMGVSPPSVSTVGSRLRSQPPRRPSEDKLSFDAPHPYSSARGSISSSTSSIGENAGLGYGNLGEPFELQTTPKAESIAEVPKAEEAPDPADGWRDEPVLYQCACVANFSPVEDRRYRALRFLPMAVGDLINVLYEVGRIDELEGFPFPTVGVEDDGLLVGAAEDGSIGLVICSFLEPLRD